MLVSDRIFVELQPMGGREHVLEAGQTIGREGCDVMVPDPDVSRRHAMIHGVDEGLGVEDLGSTNGTYLNGEPLRGPSPLHIGDRIKIGDSEFSFER
jgi:pSer/pThr/pTyr-binding forkhead associated (FHA) protein